MHDYLRTVIVAPMTTKSRPAPYRIAVTFQGKRGLILLDQIRTLDKVRLIKRLGSVGPGALASTLETLQQIFA
jgi:mRNA interferase MazF